MNYYDYQELYHHGIKGQKWGVRRFTNEDGTLTTEGKERYGLSNFNNNISGNKPLKKQYIKDKKFIDKNIDKAYREEYSKIEDEAYKRYEQKHKEGRKLYYNGENVDKYDRNDKRFYNPDDIDYDYEEDQLWDLRKSTAAARAYANKLLKEKYGQETIDKANKETKIKNSLLMYGISASVLAIPITLIALDAKH